MQFKHKDAFLLYNKYTSDLNLHGTSKMQKADAAAAEFIKEHCPLGNHKSIKLKFLRLVESKPGNKSSQLTIEKWEGTEFFNTEKTTPNPIPDDEKPKKKGRPSVTLADQPCSKIERNILKEMVSTLENFAADQGISNEDALQMTIEACRHTWKTPPDTVKCTIPVVDATALVFNVNLSTNQYQMIRTICLEHGVVFPPRNSIDQCKKLYHPEIFSTQLKSSVNPTSLLDETVLALISLVKNDSDEARNSYHLLGKFGVDGSGSHKIR